MKRSSSIGLLWLASASAACMGNIENNGPDSAVDDRVSPADSAADRVESLDVTAPADSGVAMDASMSADVLVTDSGVSPPPDAAPMTGRGVFVAQGHMGRTTISCDDGRTWVANRSMDDAARCFTGGLDCDHNSGAGRGLAFGNGYFVATFGWGMPGVVKRSRDALTWEDTLPGHTFADVAFGHGVFLANERTLQRSTDGSGWMRAGDTTARPWNVRTIEFINHGPRGRFLVSAESGADRDIVWSEDDGATWRIAAMRPAECGQYAKGFAYGNGVAILTSGQGHVCRSTDGGDSWTLINVAMGRELSSPVWTGTEFFSWAGNQLYRSRDGAMWQSTALVPSTVSIGAVARSPSGTFVSVRGGWQVWYDQQRFYRSTDGVNWDVLPNTSFVGSHPINWIEYGTVPAGTMCPTR